MRIARILFARVPTPGSVKSRLAADLDTDTAYHIYRWLLRIQSRVFTERPDPQNSYSDFVFYAPDISRLKARYLFYPDLKQLSLHFLRQSAGDLGTRLAAACETVFRSHDAALIWGADIPCLPPNIFSQATALFPQSTITLAHDGGYAFLSIAREKYSAKIFERIRWSTAHTGADQIRALRSAGVDVVVAGKVADLDHAKDLTRVIRELEAQNRTEDLADFTRTVKSFSR